MVVKRTPSNDEKVLKEWKGLVSEYTIVDGAYRSIKRVAE